MNSLPTAAAASTPLLDVLVDSAGGETMTGGGGLWGLGGLGTNATESAKSAALFETAATLAALSENATSSSSPAVSRAFAYSLIGFDGRPLGDISAALETRCQAAVADVLRRQESEEPPALFADPLEGVQLRPRNESADAVRVVYFIGVGARSTAHHIVSRLIYSLYSPTHLFLIHLDIKAAPEAAEACYELQRTHGANVRVLGARRLVQWGMFTMIATALDAIKSVLDASIGFDFFINLSDADLSLRTNAEMVRFLARMRGRSFINIHEGGGKQLQDATELMARHTIVECGGYGFVVANHTPSTFPMTHGCCIGRSGPAAYASLPLSTHPLLQSKRDVYTGSQWAVLSASFCRHLIYAKTARRWLNAFERRLVPDESLLQTVVMHSPSHRKALLNHNLRWIDWPHSHYADPNEYWKQLGERQYVGGPTVLTRADLRVVLASPYLFARKVDAEISPEVLPVWDAWMAKKLAGEKPSPSQSPIAHSPGDPQLSIGFRAPGEKLAAALLKQRYSRRIARVEFEDGSSCGCGEACAALPGGCCDARQCGGAGAFTKPATADEQELAEVAEGEEEEKKGEEEEVVEGDTGDAGESGGVGAMPRLLPLCPEEEGAVASEPGGEGLVLTWHNAARYPIELLVLDYQGREMPMRSLRRRDGTVSFNTHEGLVWRARTRGGQLVHESRPTRDAIGHTGTTNGMEEEEEGGGNGGSASPGQRQRHTAVRRVDECELRRRGAAALIWAAAAARARAAAAGTAATTSAAPSTT